MALKSALVVTIYAGCKLAPLSTDLEKGGGFGHFFFFVFNVNRFHKASSFYSRLEIYSRIDGNLSNLGTDFAVSSVKKGGR